MNFEESSVFIGISPNLCAIPSSAKTDEFTKTSTVSIAYIGIPFKQILLNALAYCNGIPFNLTETFSSF